MTPKTPAQPASAPLKPGQRARILWEVVKTTPCPACGAVGLYNIRAQQEQDGMLPIFAVVLSEYHGYAYPNPCCGLMVWYDAYQIEHEDGTVRVALAEYLEAF